MIFRLRSITCGFILTAKHSTEGGIMSIKSVASEVVADLKSALAKLEGSTAVQTVETDVKTAGKSVLSYIETNGLQDAYQIALTAVSAALPGASWASTLATIVSLAKADGVALIEGAEDILGNLAKADLVAAGTIPATAPAATSAA
jgi:hypothetical protein